MTQDGDIFADKPGAHPGRILMERDIEHPVHLVLNAPVTVYRSTKRLGMHEATSARTSRIRTYQSAVSMVLQLGM